jgi:multiple sugar transport system substrate-binding protein
MATVILRGLSWGHRRATGPLVPLSESFSAQNPDISVEWVVRPLSDFEHQSLPDLASVYDFIIYDHPFSGSIVESGAFLPLSGYSDLRVGVSDDHLWLGPSLLSYRMGGTVWGLPIDAATQHAVYRADLIASEVMPESWTAAISLGERLRKRGLHLGLAVSTPHTILTIASLMANLGCPWETQPDRPFAIDRAGFCEAYSQVQALLRLCPEAALNWNAIDLHEAMVARDDVAYCPCVYGYGTYGEADYRARLSFGPFAGLKAPYHAGSTLGGTGLAVSRTTRHLPEAVSFLAFAASDQAQRHLIPSRHGQPAIELAWHDPDIDARFNGFFSATRSSIETAWLRPRYRGYIGFQAEAGHLAAEGLRSGNKAAAVWAKIEPLLATVNT